MSEPTKPEIIVGPIVRGVAPDGLSVWVETNKACRVTVNGCSEQTFCVAGFHYAVVELTAKPSRTVLHYTVELDGDICWPPEGEDPAESAQVRVDTSEGVEIAGGSCRQQASEPLWSRHSSAEFGDLGPDALATLSHEVQSGLRQRPHLLLLTGDQVYADEQHRSVRDRLRHRRGGPPDPGMPDVTTFKEYAWLYQHTWSNPHIGWLLANVPSLMIFDDHDIIDDWNISDTWISEIALESWWAGRLEAGLMAYWVYQHLGNLSAAQRAEDPTLQAVRAADDGAEILRQLVRQIGSGSNERLRYSWSFAHHIGDVTLAVLDARNGRVLNPQNRSMLSPTDWQWFDEVVDESTSKHLLVVSSVPWLLPRGIARLERWVSGLANRPSGRARGFGELLRRKVDLEHWAAFGDSVQRLSKSLDRFLVDRAGDASACVLSGDVHFAYSAEAELGSGARAQQVVASPLRQTEYGYERAARRLAMSRVFRKAFGRQPPQSGSQLADLDYQFTYGPWFKNNIAMLKFGSAATARLYSAETAKRGSPPALRRLAEITLSAGRTSRTLV